MAVYSEIFTFNVSCGCERFVPYRFAWLNKLGGIDTYTFRLASTKNITVSRDTFSKFFSKLQSNNSFGYIKGDRGTAVYNTESREEFTVVSTWQTEEEHTWLAELFESPAAYLVSTENGQITYDPIIITSNSVTIRNKKGYVNKMLSHTISFVKAYNKVSQRG